jgi:uncharacterized protein (TIGR00266 family)
MKIDIHSPGAFASALVTLEAGESFVSDSGAMFRASANIDIDISTKANKGGGILAGVKRLIAGETFFYSTYRVTDGSQGEVGLAPTHQGGMEIVEVDPSMAWMCAGGSYVGSTGLETDAMFQGFKGLFTGESLFFLRVSGAGKMLVSAFGRLSTIDVTGPVTVDTGHVVAFQESLEYTITKAGGSWLQSFLAGEGVVMNFTGRGKLIVQSHNAKEYGRWVGPRLPERS